MKNLNDISDRELWKKENRRPFLFSLAAALVLTAEGYLILLALAWLFRVLIPNQ